MNESCHWFLLCDHDAIGTLPHQTMGPVSICERCAVLLVVLDEVKLYDGLALCWNAALHPLERHPHVIDTVPYPFSSEA